jgi:antitoxin component YwqK of YwqJK toxin-antitoxin module
MRMRMKHRGGTGRIVVLAVCVLLTAGSAMLYGQNRVDEQGRKTGQWKEEYPNGNTRYEANFHEGEPVGMMTRYYESGTKSAEMYFDTARGGCYTRMFYENGKLAAEGWFMDRQKDSVWTYYSDNDGSVRIREPYDEGNLEGMVRHYYPDGGVSEETGWKDNEKNGEWKQYYENGALRLRGSYKNDMLNGGYELFYPDSTLKIKGIYKDDQSHGTWRYFDEEGNELYAIEFDMGKAVDQQKYLEVMDELLRRFEQQEAPETIEHK